MKKGFTLIELLVVIGIIGILSASLMAVFGGASESGRAAKCQSNLRQLAQACYSVAMEDDLHKYPMAGSTEAKSRADSGWAYTEKRGWLSWLSKGKYGKDGKSSSHVQCDMPGVFSSQPDIMHAYTNGAIWRAIDGNASCFKCPTMIKQAYDKKKAKSEMAWCYAMSAKFGFDKSRGSGTTSDSNSGLSMGDIKKPDRVLMFAELCLDDISRGGNNERAADCVLEYGSYGMDSERFGFPHTTKRDSYGHVAFADGHVEQILQPKGGKSAEKDLAKWLCMGYDVSMEGGNYQKIEDSVDDSEVDDD